jgi:hypothetical protein
LLFRIIDYIRYKPVRLNLKTLWIATFINIALFSAGYVLVRKVSHETEVYKNYFHEHVTTLDFKDRLFNNKEWLILLTKELASFVEDTEWLEKKARADQQLLMAQQHYQEAIYYGELILWLSLSAVLIVLLLYLRSTLLFTALSSTLVFCSLLFLYIGIYTPMLEISAFSENLEVPLKVEFDDMAKEADDYINAGKSVVTKLSKEIGYEIDIPKGNWIADFVGNYKWDFTIIFEGRMYYFHQCKSIDNLIVLLFKDGNALVAWAILLFSVLIPIVKLGITLLLIYLPKIQKVGGFMTFVKFIGKWSMADVFVAACFLAFLSFYNMNVGIETESSTLIGIYFFLLYVIISMVASTLVWLHTLKQTKRL